MSPQPPLRWRVTVRTTDGTALTVAARPTPRTGAAVTGRLSEAGMADPTTTAAKDDRFCVCGAERGHYGSERCKPKPTVTDTAATDAAWPARLAKMVMRAFYTAPPFEGATAEPAPHVWLVLDINGRVVAVLEDDAEFAEKVAEVNRGYGWTVKRTVVRRNREGER